jgi:hypothetical protein
LNFEVRRQFSEFAQTAQAPGHTQQQHGNQDQLCDVQKQFSIELQCDERRRLWSADAWSRFGSQFRDPGLSLKLAT